jgi:hypothetical protein
MDELRGEALRLLVEALEHLARVLERQAVAFDVEESK